MLPYLRFYYNVYNATTHRKLTNETKQLHTNLLTMQMWFTKEFWLFTKHLNGLHRVGSLFIKNA